LYVHIVDPPAYTPPYDRALAEALRRAGARVELWDAERFYPRSIGPRRVSRLLQHVPAMRRYARAARAADVVHFQWLPVQWVDWALLPKGRPVVLTAHDILPRESLPGQRAGQRRAYGKVDAVVVHSEHGAARLRTEAGVDPGKVHVIPHGAFAPAPAGALPDGLVKERPVVLFFGLIRPYKGLDVLLDAWRGIDGADLWVVGRPRFDVASLKASAPSSVKWVTRFVSDAEAAAVMEAADVVVLPYREIDQSGVLFTAMGHGKPVVLTEVGGFPEIEAAVHVPPGDPAALRTALKALLADEPRRSTLAAASLRAAAGGYSWDAIAQRHLALYDSLR
jgi:glycosyltransferase involved in cell wall biosynthesis